MKATTGHGARGGFRRAALTVLAAALAACLALTAASCSSDSDDDDDSGKITWTADRVYENSKMDLTVTAKSDGTCTAVMNGETYNGTFTGNLEAGTSGTITLTNSSAELSYTVGDGGKSLTVTLPASLTQGDEQQVTLTLKDSGSSDGDGDGDSGKITWTADRVYENTDLDLTVTAKSDGTCTAVMDGETYDGTFTGNLAAGTSGTITLTDPPAVLSYTVGDGGKTLTVTLPASLTGGDETQVTLTLKDSGSSDGDSDDDDDSGSDEPPIKVVLTISGASDTSYDKLQMVFCETGEWATSKSSEVEVEGDGAYTFTVSTIGWSAHTAFADFVAAQKEKGNAVKGIYQFYVSSTDSGGNADWSDDDLSNVKIASEVYVDGTKVALTDGYKTGLSASEPATTDDDGNAVAAKPVRVDMCYSLPDSWGGPDYVVWPGVD